MGANKQQAKKHIDGVRLEAIRAKDGIIIQGQLISGGKGDHGKIEWLLNNKIKVHDAFVSTGSDPYSYKNQYRKLRRKIKLEEIKNGNQTK